MTDASVRVRYVNGVLAPLEPLDLTEGDEFMVRIEDAPEQASGLLGVVRRVQALQAAAPEGALDGGPPDLARNKDHYLYGHAKDVEE